MKILLIIIAIVYTISFIRGLKHMNNPDYWPANLIEQANNLNPKVVSIAMKLALVLSLVGYGIVMFILYYFYKLL